MLLETPVPKTILRVTFGARLCSVPFSLLGLPSAARTAKVAQRTPERTRLEAIRATNVAQGCPPDLASACLRVHLNLWLGIFSVGGSAMHMKCPDDIGREAGIGGTQNGKELNVFRACP